MDIIKKFQSIKETFYLDSLKETDVTEQAEDEEVPDEAPPDEQDPNAVGADVPDDQYAQFGMDPQMGGQPQEEENPMDGGQIIDPMTGAPKEVKSPTYLGRIYQLNKIYYRLTALQKFLNQTSDPKLEGVRKLTDDSFELFNLVMNNLPSYKNMLDKIILQYYSFISNLSILLTKYLDKKKDIDKNEARI